MKNDRRHSSQYGNGLLDVLRRAVIMTVGLLPMASYAQLSMQRYNPHFGLSARNFCDTIAIELEDDLVLLPVTIGNRQYRFCLDTGSSQGMVYRNSEISGLTALGSIVSRDANNRVDTVQVVSLPSFVLGGSGSGLVVSGYVASLMPRPAVSEKYDAVIGFDLFNRGLCGKIDTQKKVLILTDSKKFFAEEERAGYGARYKLKWFVPYLYVSPFVRHTDEVLFDTGAAQLYTMNKQSFDEHAASDLANLSKNLGVGIERQVEGRAEGRLSIGGFGVERKDEVVFLRLDRLRWGDFSFTDVRAVTTQGASKVGAQLLNYGSLIVNPFRKRLTFQPYSGADSVHVGNKQFSVAFVPMRGRAAIGLIWEGSEQYQAGMRQGDIVLQIDQRPILTFADFKRFRFIKGEIHRFRLQDKAGNEKVVACRMVE